MVKLPGAKPLDARETKIRSLTKLRFPDVGDPLSAHSIRRRRASGHVNLREIEAERYLKKLRELSDTELDNQYQTAVEAVKAEADRKEAEQPFNQPYARANVSHWAKMSYWTPDEAVALSLGCEPRFASWPTIQQLIGVSHFASNFAARREIVVRAKAMGQLWDTTIPYRFLAWAERMQFPMPGDLVEAVKALGNVVADWKTRFEQQRDLKEAAEKHAQKLVVSHTEEVRRHSEFLDSMRRNHDELLSGYISLLEKCRAKVEILEAQLAQQDTEKSSAGPRELGTRERDSLLKLVIAMATGGYGYNPMAGRSSTATEITNDLQSVGLSLDQDTVRKYLAEARELLPGGETE